VVLIPRWVALAFAALAIAVVFGLGLLGFATISNRIDVGTQKTASELILYVGIVSASALATAFIFVVGRTQHISRELDKIIALNRNADFSPELSLKRFGRLGEKITLLYFGLNALNEKRSLKISALSELVHRLVVNMKAPFLISDVEGEIAYASAAGATRLGTTRSELLNDNVSAVLKSVNLQEVVARLDRREASFDLDSDENMSVVPVNDRNHELSYIIWVLEAGTLSAGATDRPKSETPKHNRLYRRLRSIGTPNRLRR